MAAATSAAVHDLPALVSAVHEGHWYHDARAVIGAVARAHVHMHGAQADRTVVAIASVVQRLHGRAAIDANESAVLVVPRHLRLPGLSSKGAGFRFFFGLCAQFAGETNAFVLLRLWPFQACPRQGPIHRLAFGDYFRFRLREHQAFALRPNLGPLCSIERATVVRLLPHSTGWCVHVSLANFGVVPVQMVVGVVRVMRPPFVAQATILDRLAVMLNCREGFIEAVQGLAPLGVARRLAKTDSMSLDAAPPHQEEIAVLALDAGSNLHFLETLRRLDQRTRFFHRGFESGRLAFSDVQNGVLDDHSAARILSAIGASVLGSAMVRPCSFMSRPCARGKM